MSTITGTKEEIASIINAKGVKTFAYVVKAAQSDMVIIGSGSPYVEPSDRFGMYTVRFDLAVNGRPVTVDNSYKHIDNFINTIVTEISVHSVVTESVSQPVTFTWSGKEYAAAIITVAADINIEEEAIP